MRYSMFILVAYEAKGSLRFKYITFWQPNVMNIETYMPRNDNSMK